ncbi:MAG: YceD family protein [Gammaproteobacteria bacterium]
MFRLQYRALMVREIPASIDCRRLAVAGEPLEGALAATGFSRLDGAFRIIGNPAVSVGVREDEEHKLILKGIFTAPMGAECQRCLTPFSLSLHGEFEVVLVASESEAEQIDDSAVAPNGQLNLLALIEDEILLACPMIALHENETCHASERSEEPAADRQKPFAHLGDMLRKASRKE